MCPPASVLLAAAVAASLKICAHPDPQAEGLLLLLLLHLGIKQTSAVLPSSDTDSPVTVTTGAATAGIGSTPAGTNMGLVPAAFCTLRYENAAKTYGTGAAADSVVTAWLLFGGLYTACNVVAASTTFADSDTASCAMLGTPESLSGSIL